MGGLIMVESLPGGSGTPVAHFPAYDGNGNITTWVDATGSVTARLRYDAYGNILSCTDGSGTLISPLALPSEYGFSTKPADRVTGMLYYGYRYYDPVTGRWPSRDPIGERGGVNLYGFVGNNGINTHDILGQVSPQLAAAGIIAAALGAALACTQDLPDEADRKFGSNDKLKHCWVSCVVAKRCTAQISAVAQLAKEAKDSFLRIGEELGLWEDETGANDWMDSLMDIAANQLCIPFETQLGLIPGWIGSAFRESCECCCRRKLR